MGFKNQLAIGLVVSSILIAGCADKSQNKVSVEKCDIQKVVSDYKHEADELIKNNKYDNISFDENCAIEDIKTEGDFYNLVVNDAAASPKDYCKVINEYMSKSDYADVYDEKTDTYLVDHELFSENDDNYNEQGMYLINSLSEERITKESTWDTYTVYIKNKCAYNLYNGGLYYADRTLYEYNSLNYDEDISNYFQPFKFSDGKEKHYDFIGQGEDEINHILSEKYELIDGEMSISTGINTACENINKYYIVEDNKRGFNATSVDVMRIRDKYFYVFDVQLIYDNIPFLTDGMGSYSVSEFSTVIPFQCYIAKSNGITAVTALKGNNAYEQAEKLEKVYDLASAVRLASEKLADNVRLNVSNIEFGYAQFKQGESYRLGWMLCGNNLTRNERMSIFIDASEGKVYMNVS